MNDSIAAPRASVLPELDGIRGVAVLLVMLFHLGWLAAGWIGVQLFFVLSGFLITRILVQDAQRQPLGTYLGRFYLRRALRIFPLYFLYLAFLAGMVATQARLAALAGVLPSAMVFLLNFQLAAGAATDQVLLFGAPYIGHLWSLSVEEHFYLFWPLLVFALHGRVRTFCLLLIAAGPLLRALAAWGWPMLYPRLPAAEAVYVLSTSHLDAFAAGALAGLLPALDAGRRRLALAILAAALGLLLLAGKAVNGSLSLPPLPGRPPLPLGYPITLPLHHQYLWGYSAINLCAALLLWIATSGGALQTLFQPAWLRFTGRISYGLYVAHFPLVIPYFLFAAKLAERLPPTQARVLAGAAYFAAVYGIAALSFFFWEQRFLRLKDRWSSSRAQAPPAA